MGGKGILSKGDEDLLKIPPPPLYERAVGGLEGERKENEWIGENI
jgi:hypothetical protein